MAICAEQLALRCVNAAGTSSSSSLDEEVVPEQAAYVHATCPAAGCPCTMAASACYVNDFSIQSHSGQQSLLTVLPDQLALCWRDIA